MKLLINGLSVHEQFHDNAAFLAAFSCIMDMRAIARRYGQDLRCHREFLNRYPRPGETMHQAIRKLSVERRRAAMAWLTKEGPFWEDTRQHTGDDWLECRGEIVTDTAIGEAAYEKLKGSDCGLVSFSPSSWEIARVKVMWCREVEGLKDASFELENWWNGEALEGALQGREAPVRTWGAVEEICTGRFEGLTFSDDCFEPLKGVPFAESAADRILSLLGILESLSCERNNAGAFTEEGKRIRQEHFTGERALFSDSSKSEKQKFRKNLTFGDPEEPGAILFCPWHGKVSHLTLRLHFYWPPQPGKPVPIVYVGPKITKR